MGDAGDQDVDSNPEDWYDKPLKLCVVIGVANPERLEPLPGAWNAAEGLGLWAQSQGYKTLVFTDEPQDGRPNPVTAERLRSEINLWVTDSNIEKERLIIAFAGHGAADGLQDLWLLNGWYRGPEEAISVSRLQTRLETWGFRQICIIKDACRTAIKNSPDIGGTCLISLGDAQTLSEFDILESTRAGRSAYMVIEQRTSKPYCLFSQVLIDALNGRLKGSVDATRMAVSTHTLRQTVPSFVREAANRFGKQQDVRITPGFIAPHDIYTELSRVDTSEPPVAFAPWPDDKPRLRRTASPKPAVARKPRANPPGNEIARSAPDRSIGRAMRDDLVRWEMETGGPPVPVPPTPAALFRASLIGGFTPPEDRSTLRTAVEVFGGQIVSVVLPDGRDNLGRSAQGEIELPDRPSSLALKLASGLWIGASVLPNFTLKIALDQRGASSLIYRPTDWAEPRVAIETADAIADLQAGGLSEQVMRDIATWVRQGKRADPVRSVIAAAFYARLGDLDNIRRTAWYVHQYGQAIPPDLALLGRFTIKRKDDQLIAFVPATPQRTPEAGAELEVAYATHATPAVKVRLAGIAPWLRQSWEMFEVVPGKRAAQMAGLEPFLTRALFTTLTAEGGERLAAIIDEWGV